MENVGRRILALIEKNEKNLTSFCRKYDKAQSTWSLITTGKRAVGMDVLKQILAIYPDTNLNWLLLGKDEPENLQKSNKSITIGVEEEPSDYSDSKIIEHFFIEYLKKSTVKKVIGDIVEDKIDELKKK